MNLIRKIRNGIFGFSLLIIALGAFLLVEPTASVYIICYLFGGIIIICGGIDLTSYFISRKNRKYFRFDLIKGIAMLILGLFIIIRPEFVSAILPTIFGLVLILDGIAKILSAFDIRSGRDKAWIGIMAFGFVVCILGFITVIYPFTAVTLSMRVIGISLICDGVSNIWCNFCLKKRLKDE